MKKLLSFAVLFNVTVTAASAQVQRRTDSTQNRITGTDKNVQKMEMLQSLNLSKEQMGQLKELRRIQKQRRESITSDQNFSDAQRRQKLRELHREQNEKLKTILTPGKMEKMKAERKNKTGQRRQPTTSSRT